MKKKHLCGLCASVYYVVATAKVIYDFIVEIA